MISRVLLLPRVNLSKQQRHHLPLLPSRKPMMQYEAMLVCTVLYCADISQEREKEELELALAISLSEQETRKSVCIVLCHPLTH